MQAQEPVFIHLTEKDGLPDKEFYDILEDDKGFIWLSADKGLYRYDGKEFKGYNAKEQRGLSVFYLQQDYLKRIWCTNISGQFFYVQDDKLQLFKDLSKELKGELSQFEITKDYLYVFTQGEIYQVSLKTKKTIQIYKARPSFGSPFKFQSKVYFENSDSISSINSNHKLENVLSTRLALKDKYGRVPQGKSQIFKIGTSLILKQKRLDTNMFFKINILDKELNKIELGNGLANERIYSQFENDNEIWFATNSGVWVFGFKNNRFLQKRHFIKDKKITKILKDKDDNFWFTSLNSGVYVIPNLNIEISNISQQNKNITSLDKVNDSILVFGTAKGNVSFYNTISNIENTVYLPTKDRVSTLKYHPNENEVFISKDFSAFRLNYKTLEQNKLSHFQTIKSMFVLENNDLLYTDFKKVSLLKDSDFNNKQISISTGKRTYTSFYNQINKDVYIAYVDDLVVYDSLWNSKIIRHKDNSIYAKSITKTSNGIIWVATFKDGVFGIDNNKIIKHLSTLDGLTSNNIGKIKADNNTLWITTDNSIQVLDILTQKITTLTKRDGIVSYDISGIEIQNNKVFFSSSNGLFSLNKEKLLNSQNSTLYFNKIEINEKDAPIKKKYELKYNQNAIKIDFNVNGFLYNQKGRYKYRLKGFNDQWLVTDIGENTMKYNSLPAGRYTFQAQPFLDNKTDKTKIKEIKFVIKKPFWEQWWFVLTISGIILGSIVFYFRRKIKIKEIERIKQLEKISLEKELIAQNLTALRSQMNPHFIFNALNSIQDLVLKQDTDASYDYIVLFAELIRNTLSYSNQDFIPIEKELEFLKVYLKLEKLRFGNDFAYLIQYKGEEDLEVPSLLIQPFIENALVHGLLHKSGKKELKIIFHFIENTLQCTITDNGIGRGESKKIADRQGDTHESFALTAIEKRLKIFKKQYNNVGYVIEDLYKDDIPIGTKVILTMPFIKRF